MADKILFISHIHEDADVAGALKALIEDAFIGSIDVFVSSDPTVILPGDDWRQKIRDNLRLVTDFIILLTPRSLERPWVNFEAGAACGRGTRFIPVCARGLSIAHVVAPLGDPQMITLDTGEHVERLIAAIAAPYKYTPKVDKIKVAAVVECASPKYDDLPPPLTPDAKKNEAVFLRQMREEYDALTAARQVFWETLEDYYARNFAGKPGYPNTLNGLVDLAEPARGLPVPRGEELRDYPTRHRRLLAGSDATLYDFCTLVYPPKQPGKNLEDCTALEKSAFDKFHVPARGALAKFWNR